MNADDPWWLSNKRTATHLVCTFACGLMLVTLGSRTPWVWLDCICTAKSIRGFWDTHCLCSHCSASCRDATNPFCFFFEYTPEVLWCFFFWIQSRIFGPQELASGGGATAFPQKKTLRLTALSSILAPANICHSDMDKHVEQCRTRAC